MPYETLLLKIDERIATLVVNRPDRRNALNATVRRELKEAFDALEEEDDVRVVLLRGAGEKAFVAGADIGEFAERSPLEQRNSMAHPRIFDVVAAFPKPTIAVVNGYALGGGCELALACDTRIAARSARFGQPEVRLGILPGGGGTQRLPRLVGYGRAMRMILTGEMVDAEEALRIGLVEEVVDDADLERRAGELAAAVAQRSPVALRLAKAGVRAAMEMPLSAGLDYERELFVSAFSSEDRTEGVEAFMEKREPDFKGR